MKGMWPASLFYSGQLMPSTESRKAELAQVLHGMHITSKPQRGEPYDHESFLSFRTVVYGRIDWIKKVANKSRCIAQTDPTPGIPKKEKKDCDVCLYYSLILLLCT